MYRFLLLECEKSIIKTPIVTPSGSIFKPLVDLISHSFRCPFVLLLRNHLAPFSLLLHFHFIGNEARAGGRVARNGSGDNEAKAHIVLVAEERKN